LGVNPFASQNGDCELILCDSYRDLRANLEVAISKVFNLAVQANVPPDSDYTSDCEDSPSISCNQALTAAVRKDLASAIGDLLQHGLMHVSLKRFKMD